MKSMQEQGSSFGPGRAWTGCHDRKDAGEQLARQLAGLAGREDVLVLALPRGGVPVGFEISSKLGVPLDVLVVRKLGAPGQPELAMGAIASGGVRVVNDNVVSALGIDDATLDRVSQEETRELVRREKAYRGSRAFPSVHGITVILVDDGVATGATLRAALRALRAMAPARIILAIPHGSPDSVSMLSDEADQVICLATPDPYLAVGAWYEVFDQTSDAEVSRLLAQAPGAAGESQ